MFKPALASLLLVGALPASGQTLVYSVMDFDTVGSSYAQADTGPVGPGGKALNYGTGQNTDGVTGAASTHTFDFTGQTGFTQAKVFYNLPSYVAGSAVSNDASDYEISFDIRADGLMVASRDANFKLKLDGVEFTATVAYTDTYNTITLNLGDDMGGGAGFTSSAFSTGTKQVEFQIGDAAKTDRFGADSGNAMYLDNVQINVIPEPASAALLAGGTLCLMARRRLGA